MPKAWVTGAGGLIGSYLVNLAPRYAFGWEVLPLTRQTVDLADEKAVRELFERSSPDLIMHCAGLTQTGPCEKQPELARQMNVGVTSLLCELASRIQLFFFSTDLVFNGAKGNYVETDPVSPLLVYAQTKVEAEKVVLQNPKHTVIRTALNGGASPKGNRGFNEELRRAWGSRQDNPIVRG